jgi:AcrR family transcriptional regulator
MANDVKAPARRALVDAAKRLLPARSPSTVTGRELAAEAGVNYGLVHHHFGGKDAVFREALLELREEFLESHAAHDLPSLLFEPDDPYVLAVARTQIGAEPEVQGIVDFPIGDATVATVADRVRGAHPDWTDAEVAVEAKARAVAMIGLQLAYSVYNATLLDTVGVTRRERADVEAAVGRLYRELSARR